MGTTDNWLGGNHNFDEASDWSDGVPTLASNVLVASGQVAVTSAFDVDWFTLKKTTTLAFVDAGSSATTYKSINSGTLNLDVGSGQGGSNLTIGGGLSNSGRLQIGAADHSLGASDTLSVTSLTSDQNRSVIDIYGGTTARATVDVGSAASLGYAGRISGQVTLSGNALLEFTGKSQFTTIDTFTDLTLNGPDAVIADARLGLTSNSALEGLSAIYGGLELENGAKVATTGALSIGGDVSLDAPAGASTAPGSSLVVGGALTIMSLGFLGANNGDVISAASLDVQDNGIVSLEVRAQLSVAGLITNDGTILIGNASAELTQAVLGQGQFQLYDGGALAFDAGADQQRIAFLHVDSSSIGETLKLGDPVDFSGQITGFDIPGDEESQQADTIEAVGFGQGTTIAYAANATNTAGTLTLTDAGKVAHVALTGVYSSGGFGVATLSDGNSQISYKGMATNPPP